MCYNLQDASRLMLTLLVEVTCLVVWLYRLTHGTSAVRDITSGLILLSSCALRLRAVKLPPRLYRVPPRLPWVNLF